MNIEKIDALLAKTHTLPIDDNRSQNLSGDELLVPERTLSFLYPHFTLEEMRSALWNVFSRSIVDEDAKPGKFSRTDLLRLHDICVIIIESGFYIANDYLKAASTRKNSIEGLNLGELHPSNCHF